MSILNDKQESALKRCCERFETEFKPEEFHRGMGVPSDWVEGWIGNHIYVGCSPEGEIHS